MNTSTRVRAGAGSSMDPNGAGSAMDLNRAPGSRERGDHAHQHAPSGRQRLLHRAERLKPRTTETTMTTTTRIRAGCGSTVDPDG